MNDDIKKVDPASSASPSEAPVGMPPISPPASTFQPVSPPISPSSFTPPPVFQQNVPPVPPSPMGTSIQPDFSVPPQPKFEPVERVGATSIPPAPAPDIGIRTMASDLSSLKASGGLEAKPTTFNPEEFTKGQVFEYSKPAASEAVKVISNKSTSKILFVSLGIVAFVALAGLVIYFLILPMVLPKGNPPIIGTPVNVQPPIETNPPLVHQSFFTAQNLASTPLAVNLINLKLAEINPALSVISSDVQLKTAREATILVSGSVPETVNFLSIAFPEIDKNFVASNFEKDFTVFLYRDVNGSWPGYIFRLNSDANLSRAADVMKVIESSTNIPNLYLKNPGTSNPAGFKNGLKIGENAIRYLSFEAPGSSFDYGWFNNYLIVTTSFDGFKEALKLLGSSS